jgi:DNA polymerase
MFDGSLVFSDGLLSPEQLANAAHLDTEGWGSEDLPSVGAYKWVDHHYVGMWCFVWSMPGYGRQKWFPWMEDPEPFLQHIRNGGVVIAHNMSFDRLFWNFVIRRYKPHWPEIRLEQCECTKARASAISIPGKLEMAAQVLGIEDFEKESVGSKLTKHYATAKYDKRGHRIWPTAEEIQQIGVYCDKDVAIEEGVTYRTIPLSDRERRVWLLDQTINDRGFAIDIPLVQKLAEVVKVSRERLKKKLSDLTGGLVTSSSQHARVAQFVQSRGLPFTKTSKDKIPEIVEACRAIDWEGFQDVIEVLDLKRQGGKSSVDKLFKMLECVCKDGRLHGQLEYHGASTGRWAGRLTQPQNFYRIDAEKDGDDIEKTLEIVMRVENAEEACDAIEAMFFEYERKARGDMKEGAQRKSVMDMIAKCIRSTIIAAPGYKLIGGDKSNIEGRINAWIHDEAWKGPQGNSGHLRLLLRHFVWRRPGVRRRPTAPNRKGPGAGLGVSGVDRRLYQYGR